MFHHVDVFVQELNIVLGVTPVVVDPVQGYGVNPAYCCPANVQTRKGARPTLGLPEIEDVLFRDTEFIAACSGVAFAAGKPALRNWR